MPKHESRTMSLSEIIDSMSSHTDTPWYEVMEIDIQGLEEANANGESDDWVKASEIEAKYLQEHGDDEYLVSWPEHVIYPRFNSDASYHLLANEYPYKTDSESGVIVAPSFAAAKRRLIAMLPDIAIADGGWGWVQDYDGYRFRCGSDE